MYRVLRKSVSQFLVLVSPLFFSVVIFSGVTTASVSNRFYQDAFPKSPDPTTTPGSLCDHPDSYRYPERVAYCEREVEESLKWKIIELYNVKLGYQISPRDRAQFKIDHHIPLCAGGSNLGNNLWPQHKSVYVVTDPLENLICEKMKVGRLRQRQAIQYITTAKQRLDLAPRIIAEVRAL